MLKKRVLVIVLLIVAVLALFPIVSKAYYASSSWGKVNFSLNDLNIRQNDSNTGNHSFSFLCIARGYTLSENSVLFNRYANIKIEGIKATNKSNNKTSSSKANAILGYIAHQASNEKIDNNTQYYNTQSQNAAWKYWKTWYNSSGKALGVSNCFDITSRPFDSNKCNSCLTKAEEYYQYLVGNKKGISLNKNGATTSKKDSNGYYFYGPFTIKRESNSFVKDGFTIEKNSDIEGIISKDNYNNGSYNTGNIGTKGSFGTQYYLVTKKTGNLKPKISYKVPQYNLELNLYHHASTWADWQNIAKIKSIEKERSIIFTTPITVEPQEEPPVDSQVDNISIQKFIVETGKNFTENGNTGIISNRKYGYNDNTEDKGGRANTRYIASSNTNITKNIMANGEFIKQNNPVLINNGDYVVYKIIIYNNTENMTKDIDFSFIDRFDKNAELVGIYPVYENGEYKDKRPESENGKIYYTYKDEDNYSRFQFYTKFYKNTADGPKDSRSFWVVLHYNKDFTGISINNVWIAGNRTIDYRKGDSDCVKMEEPKSNVSLQKYITKVIRNGNSIEIKDNNGQYIRKDKKAHQLSVEEIYKNWPNNPNNYLKIYNPVNIIAGDIVQYAITVYNNSDEIDETGVKIEDTLPEGATGYYVVGSSGDGVFKEIPSDKKIEIKDISLAKGEQKTYYINVKFDNYISNIGYSSETNNQNLNNNNSENIDNTQNSNNNENIDIENYEDDEDQDEDEVEVIVEEDGIDNSENDENTENNNNKEERVLINSAKVTNTKHENNTPYRTNDDDYVIMKQYKVSLEKFVSKVNNTDITGRKGNAEHRYDNDTSTKNDWKYNHVVTVSSGNMVDYTIIVKNDGDTTAYITSITDTLPSSGVDYSSFTIGSVKKYNSENSLLKNLTATVGLSNTNVKNITLTTASTDYLLNPGDYILIEASVRVTASNMSIEIYKNTAKITQIRDENKTLVNDATLNDNEDSDYIQLKDIKISGTVWNDINPLKDNNPQGYNGLYNGNGESESKLSNIAVKLYRVGITSPIAEKTTDANGNYSFTSSDIVSSINTYERYIKGPKNTNNNRWAGTYYSYYIVFEYNGITYTSTIYREINASDYIKNSNAQENKTARENFNKKFKTIKSDGAYNQNGNKTTDIDYDRYIGITSDEKYIIPQSIYQNNETMKMQSSTKQFSIADYSEDQINNINLGLRGRDVLDLKIKTDIDNIKVNVNGVSQDYKNTNTVEIRKNKFNNKVEDAANVAGDTISENNGQDQDIRRSDKDYLNSIEVIYKITVTNESTSPIDKVSIIDYYDSRYTFKEASVQNCILNSVIDGNNNSKIVTITGTGEIYLTYGLNTPKATLNADIITTFNMAEIYEYSTKTGENEATRGLIDLDSRPGMVNAEKVILTDDYENIQNGNKGKIIEGALNSRKTTLDYYFANDNLQKLMYEDDTAVKAVIYKYTNNNARQLSGYVFEDYAPVDPLTKIKSGNGLYKDVLDKPVYGATVELNVPGITKSYTATTDKNGYYRIDNFVPGKGATLTFKYGDTVRTVLLNQSDDGTLNQKSYNGEDYQSTNNKALNTTGDYWYITNESKGKNEAISIAKDNTARRATVSENVSNSNELIELLNKAKNGKTDIDVNKIIENTSMYANTEPFTLDIEKATEDGVRSTNSLESYEISNMNFGIAQVPVTTIKLVNNISKIIITDAAGDNTIVEATRNNDGTWTTKGIINVTPDKIVSQIEEQKLQGAKLQIKYAIGIEEYKELDFNGVANNNPTVKSIINFIDNNLSFNSKLEDNNNWDVISITDVKNKFGGYGAVINKDKEDGKITNENTAYNTILKVKDITKPITLTLEKTLSSQDVTLENIIPNSNSYEYGNNIEIFELDYSNTLKDRVRSEDGYIIVAGKQNDYKAAESATIIPPLGENNDIKYYVIAVASVAILAAGVILIKKYIIK